MMDKKEDPLQRNPRVGGNFYLNQSISSQEHRDRHAHIPFEAKLALADVCTLLNAILVKKIYSMRFIALNRSAYAQNKRTQIRPKHNAQNQTGRRREAE